ncbi:MAG: hypothetical protein HUU41_11780 [Bryobacteraceae bacterium]|nr:hypothetical protein [Bryobacterales bacterium]NUN01786.1 hypothetical protein [Bryobacteraceae bacterium]
MSKFCLIAGLLLQATLLVHGQNTVAAFAEKAYAVLPVEEPYTFHKELSEWREPLRRDAGARPGVSEMPVGPRGWRLLVRNDSGLVLRTAAEEFSEYLERSMQVKVALEHPASMAEWNNERNAIIAGTREQLPGCGESLKGPKDYRIAVSPGRIIVCGYDERGAMYGLFDIERRMNLREAPFLERTLDITRHSLFKARMVLSGLGWEEWPDRYLALLARYGFDSIFASVYVNPNGVPGPPPYWDRMKKQDPKRVHDLIRRAARYGIELYCPIIYLYTGEPENEAGLRKLVRDIVTEFPQIRGYILLTEGFFYKSFFGAGGQGNIDLRDWVRHWARGVAIVSEECRKLNPDIEVLPWEYNIDFRPNQVDLKRYGTAQLPVETIPLLTFENGKAFERDGERGSLKDYAINEVGPAEVTIAQIDEARKRGMRGVYSKADTFASWQYGTFPYLPFPYQWYARYMALEKYKIDGTMETWSYGFKPSWMAEVRAWYSWSGYPELNQLLTGMARREFGAGSEDLVLTAWKRFSEAIKLVPDTGPNMGTNNSVATPLFFRKPKARAMTLDHSWEDPAIWQRHSQLWPYWPYTPRRLILVPDFANESNAAERYARPFSLQVFNKYLALAADQMERGLLSYRQAALKAPASKRAGAMREVLLAEQLQRMMRSDRAVLEFEDMRFRLAKTADRVMRLDLLKRMTALLQEERTRTQHSLETARRDSRLGYEWEQDYIYTPDHIEEKLKVIDLTLKEQIPEYAARQ